MTENFNVGKLKCKGGGWRIIEKSRKKGRG
jgi:hypothetical protein